MVDFKTLKTTRNTNIDKLTSALEEINNPKSQKVEDPRFWKPTRDKDGNGYAVIRFLPAPPVDGEDGLPWVRYWDHAFQGPGGWYIENSLTTLGQKDPVSEHNSKLWATGNEADKDTARQQKRQLHYVANIYVVNDEANPANNGTVRLYRFGKKIFDKITEAMKPQFADETPVNPFDLWKGANFKLKIRTVKVGSSAFPNYDKSEFDSVKPLADDDDALENIWKSEHSLKEFLDPANFKPYDELKKRLETVLQTTDAPQVTATTYETVTAKAVSSEAKKKDDDDSDADLLAKFEKLANEDYSDEPPF